MFHNGHLVTYYLVAFLFPISFLRFLAEREIIANAFNSPDFSPNRGQRYNYYLYFDALLRKKYEKSWKITEKRQSMDLTVVEKKVKGNRGKG